MNVHDAYWHLSPTPSLLIIRSNIFFLFCQVYSIQDNFQRQGYLILSSRGSTLHSSYVGRERLPFWASWTSSHLVAVTGPFWNRRARRGPVLTGCHLIKELRSLTALLFEILWRHSFGSLEDSPMNKSREYNSRVTGLQLFLCSHHFSKAWGNNFFFFLFFPICLYPITPPLR